MSPSLRIEGRYETRAELYSYLKKFVRKRDHKLFLFGYLSISGSEIPLVSPNEAASAAVAEGMARNIRHQNRPGSNFNMRNVRQLFLDGQGTFNSGPTSLSGGDICLVSGAFFRELDRETVETPEEMAALFQHVTKVSEQVGHYSVLRGLKE